MPKEPQQDMRGVLFKDNKHEKIDYSGSATIGGREYWISGWKKESQGGMKYISLSFTPKNPEQSVQVSRDNDGHVSARILDDNSGKISFKKGPDIQFPKKDDDIPF